MIVKILLGVLYLSGWLILSKCRRYYFVNEPLDWGTAQSYCRRNYTDLAKIENLTEMKQLINTVSSAGYNSEVWIGAYFYIYGYVVSQINDDFWKWENQTENEPFLVYYFCARASVSGWQWYNDCSVKYPFICYKGTSQSHENVFVNESMDWFRALGYCRRNFTDLAPAWFSNSELQNLVPNGAQAWIGHIARPYIAWSDGRDSSFRYWDDSNKIFGFFGILYGVADLQRSGKWRLIPYYTKLPFVCYDNLPAPQPKTTEAVHKKVIKMRLKLEDSSVDLNDTSVKANLLKMLQDRLQEKGVNGVTVKWREQPDGAVFHREEKKKKKSEL